MLLPSFETTSFWKSRARSRAVLVLLLAGAACSESRATFEHADPTGLARVEAALELSVLGNDHAAFQLLSAALEELPRSFEVRFEYASSAVRTERLALGIEAYEELWAAEPERLAVARNLAHASLSGGFLEHAAPPILWLSGRAEASGFDLDLASRLAFERGDLVAAEDWARKAVSRAPDNARAVFQLARVLLAAEDPGARGALERTLALDPGQTQARFALGTLELQSGNQQAGELQLAQRELLRRLKGADFRVLAAKPRLEVARQISRELPAWSEPLLEIARAQLELGQPKKAQETLERAAELRPDSLDRIELQYAAALARGERRNAREWLAIWKERSEHPDQEP